MILPGSYANGFAPRDAQHLYPELWRGCVGAWAPCLGPTGLTLRDWSGFGNHGTLTNMDANSDWVAKNGQYAIDYDGTDDICAVNRYTFSGDFTIATFFAATTYSATKVMFGDSVDSGSLISFLSSATTLTVRTQTSTLLTFAVPTLSINTVYHLVVTRSNGSMRVYLNGKESTTGARSDTTTLLINRIGSYLTPSLGWSGLLDDTRFYAVGVDGSGVAKLASRRGISYDLATRRRSRIFTGGFNAYWAARRSLIIGGGLR